jgi:glycine betaine/proline transport system ATP-binding protein
VCSTNWLIVAVGISTLTITPAQTAKIAAHGVYKIYGDDPDAAVKELQDGASKQEILERSGQVVAVQDATFHVVQGEIFVVMGLSGSGKSTIIRMINRLIEPTYGEIWFDGQDVTAMDPKELVALRRRDIAMVFQSFALMPHLNNLENAAFGLDIAGVGSEERTCRAMKALQTVGLEAYAGSFPDELSGGMQQRVGLARALALNPTVLLMDEAFSALDPLIRVDMQRELLRLRDAQDLTVVFISHDLDEALRVGDRLAIMDDGAIIQIGKAQEIITDPANEYVRSFFGRANVAEVLTAADLARMDPAAIFRRPVTDLAGTFAALRRRGYTFGFVVDRTGNLEGVVSQESLKKLQSQTDLRIDNAFLPDVPRIGSTTRLEDCFDVVANAPFDVPVTDNQQRFLGTVNKSQLLRALSKKT